jgi:hypothetical protein
VNGPDRESQAQTNASTSITQYTNQALGPTVNSIEGGQVSFITNVREDPTVLTTMQRCGLAAACLLVACGFGYLILSSPQIASDSRIAVWIVTVGMFALVPWLIPWRALFFSKKVQHVTSHSATIRDRLIIAVDRLWIEQALHRSLQRVIYIEVGLAEQDDAIADPWGTTRLSNLRDPIPLPPGITLADLYPHDRVRRIVVVGSPGSGKTTHLLQLAESLLAKARDDLRSPAPVILRLSDWQVNSSRLDKWLVFEMGIRYRIPPETASSWLQGGSVSLLLDGLDEVEAKRRVQCVRAVAEFCEDPEYLQTGLVVTCRTAEYEALGRRLPFDMGLQVEPLSYEQIEHVLAAGSIAASALRKAIRRDHDLAELVTTPLMLGIAILATGGAESHRQIRAELLFPLYVRRMLTRNRALRTSGENTQPIFSPHQTYRHLVWLARLMQMNHQSAFYLDWVTPDWLPDASTPWELPPRRGLLGRVSRRIGWNHTSTALIGAVYAALFSAAAGAPLGAQVNGWIGALIVAAVAGTMCGTVAATVFGVVLRKEFGKSGPVNRALELVLGRPVQNAYAAQWKWSWRQCVRGIPTMSVAALLVGGLGGVLTTVHQGGAAALVIAFGVALSNGNSPDQSKTPASPGSALAASLRRLAILVLVLIAFVLFVALLFAWLDGPWTTIIASLPLTCALMLIAGPGRSWLRNRAAFFGLTAAGLLPRAVSRFLWHADERILMRQAGGGYVFLHRTLQEHLADQDPEGFGSIEGVPIG